MKEQKNKIVQIAIRLPVPLWRAFKRRLLDEEMSAQFYLQYCVEELVKAPRPGENEGK